MTSEFGKSITAEDIVEQTDFFDDWEEKYAFLIDLGKQLPAFNSAEKSADNLVKGCQSDVWITHAKQGEQFVFFADSDAIIVKGLLAVILAAYNYKTAEEILDFDIEGYFEKLDLLSHISNVRGNGIQAMVARIRGFATPAG
ncbi:MAG: Fe-S cluster assembly protein SufE [Gammaproteobacteria bacterium]|nr:MAG: Fe-S cluster assembly protein SufE [Gammaproteobacteria bacterium]